jgi:hypothetical protein
MPQLAYDLWFALVGPAQRDEPSPLRFLGAKPFRAGETHDVVFEVPALHEVGGKHDGEVQEVEFSVPHHLVTR